MNENNMELYTDKNPKTTIKGLGFKNKDKAIYTINKIKDKPIIYQFQAINTMYYRAKHHPHRTKDMEEAMKIFKKWLDNYKKKYMKGGNKYKYLKYNIVQKFQKLAEYYNISKVARGLEKPKTSDVGFLNVYKKNKNNPNKLNFIPVKKNKPNGTNWNKTRINRLNAKIGQIKKMKIKLYHTDGKLKGIPTKMHTILIMWAYSPDEKRIINLSKNITNIINNL